MTPLSENKLSTTENVTTSDEVHKRTQSVTKRGEVVKGDNEVHNCTQKITTNKEVDKGTEKLENMIEVVVRICRKDSDKFEGQYKGSTRWFNIDHEFKRIKISTLEPGLY